MFASTSHLSGVPFCWRTGADSVLLSGILLLCRHEVTARLVSSYHLPSIVRVIERHKRDLKNHLVSTQDCHSPDQTGQTPHSLASVTSRDGAPTTLIGSLCQCLTISFVKTKQNEQQQKKPTATNKNKQTKKTITKPASII